jgi:hypothetical protein
VPPDAKRYTAEEATAMLPELVASLGRIRAARQTVLEGSVRIRAGAPSNGGGTPTAGYWEALATLRSEVQAIAERGILLRDPESGLLDFPTRLAGRDVFLCWRLGEERVGHWHGPETGFSGRRPLPEDAG